MRTRKKNLQATILGGLKIRHEIEVTMVDGKVATILSDIMSATTSCSICGMTSSNLNDLEKLQKTNKNIPVDRFKHGMSTLHLWITSMECYLHITYRLDFKTWQVRGQDKKELLRVRKEKL